MPVEQLCDLHGFPKPPRHLSPLSCQAFLHHPPHCPLGGPPPEGGHGGHLVGGEVGAEIGAVGGGEGGRIGGIGEMEFRVKVRGWGRNRRLGGGEGEEKSGRK